MAAIVAGGMAISVVSPKEANATDYATTAAATDNGLTIVITANGVTVSPGSNDTNFAAVTDTSVAQDGNITITSDADADALSFASIAIGGNLTFTGVVAKSVAITNSGALTLGGNFVMNGDAQTIAAKVATFIQTGAVAITGTTLLQAGRINAINTTSITLAGATNVFTGATTLTAGAGNAANDALIDINGASASFDGGLVMTSVASGGQAILEIGGGVDQIISGTIDGSATQLGNILINQSTSAIVTFADNIGSTQDIALITITDATETIFNGDVNVSSAGGAGDNVITVANSMKATFNKDLLIVDAAGVEDDIVLSGTSSVLKFGGTAAQTVRGHLVVAGDGQGTVQVANSGGKVTFNGIFSVAGAGVKKLAIEAGSHLDVVSANADAITFDVVTTVSNLANGSGGDLTVRGGNGVTTVAGGVVTLATITTTTKLTNLTLAGGNGGTSGVGAAITDASVLGAVTLSGNLSITGGNGGTLLAGTGGAITDATFGGAITAAQINITGGDGGIGRVNNTGVGAVGGALADSNFSGLITGDWTMTGGNGGEGGAGGAGATGGVGGAGGLVLAATMGGGLTGDATFRTGDGADAGAGGATGLGGNGGAGGAVTLSADINNAGTPVNLTIISGAGGQGGASGAANGGIGGASGAFILPDFADAFTGNLVITGGDGGTGGAGTGTGTGGVGGAGTAISESTTSVFGGGATFTAGAGGSGGAGTTGIGGQGGAGANVTIGVTGGIAGLTTINDGIAGTAGAAGTAAGGVIGTAGVVALTLGGGTARTYGTLALGSIAVNADGAGTVIINNSHASNITTFGGDIGSSTKALGTLTHTNGFAKFDGDVFADNITGGSTAGDGVDFNGNVTSATGLVMGASDATFAKGLAGVVTLASGSDAAFDGTTDQAVSAVIDGGGAIASTNTGGTVTFSSAVGTTTDVGAITHTGATKTVFKSTVDAASLGLSGTGTATFDGKVTLSGALAVASGSTITLTSGFIAGETVFDTTSGAGTAQITTGATVNMPSTFASGSLVLIDNDGNSGAADAALITVNGGTLSTFTVAVGSDASKTTITAVPRSASAIATTLGVSAQEAAAVTSGVAALHTGDAAGLAAMQTALNAGGATARVAAEQIGIQTDTLGAASSTSVSAGGRVIGVASNRLASMRSVNGTQYASTDGIGFNTGDMAMKSAAWIKPFGSTADQDNKASGDGFDSDTFGVAAGIDTQISQNVRIGASFAYSGSDVVGKGSGASTIDIKSYQGTLYGDYTANGYYVEGMVGYALNENETTRKITFANRTASADYDSKQYMVSLGGGIPMELESNTFFTPTGGLSYTRVSSDTYTETGASNLNLTIKSDDVDSIVGSIGAKLHTSFKQGNTTMVPQIRAGLNYDFSGEESVATGNYTGGGANFKTTGADVQEFGGNVGVGIMMDSHDGMTLSANYDADIKSGFVSHAASLEARFKF